MINFNKIYILGIGGTGMSSIAKYISQSGLKVKGYDQRKSYITNTLQQEGIDIDFSLDDITYESDTLYIYSTAFNISKTNRQTFSHFSETCCKIYPFLKNH